MLTLISGKVGNLILWMLGFKSSWFVLELLCLSVCLNFFTFIYCVCAHAWMHVCVYMYVYVHVCICACVCIYVKARGQF